MNKNNKKLALGLVLISFLITSTLAACSTPEKSEPEVQEKDVKEPESEKPVEAVEQGDIKILEPKAGDKISFPFIVKGEAKGTWYFEAFFPVSIVDADGNVLATSSAQAIGDWMTEDFVPFELTFEELNSTEATEGKIIFEKANPSGMPENADTYEVPILF